MKGDKYPLTICLANDQIIDDIVESLAREYRRRANAGDLLGAQRCRILANDFATQRLGVDDE